MTPESPGRDSIPGDKIPAIVQRRAERSAHVDTVRRWARDLDPALGVRAVVIFGSVARGDFNVWSDIDVLVIADSIPEPWPARLAKLWANRPAQLSPLAWTPEEYRDRLARRDQIAVEASEGGIVVRGGLEDIR